MTNENTFMNLNNLVSHLREVLDIKNYILLYAYNHTGKTRLSNAFKEKGKSRNKDGVTVKKDTLYYNAFTEDLFIWDNDLENENKHKLKLNQESSFLNALPLLEIETSVNDFLKLFTDIGFQFDTTNWEVIFVRELKVTVSSDSAKVSDGELDETDHQHKTYFEKGIKVSRGEENIFVWCFFLAIIRLVLDDDGDGSYNWVKYIYIDDPISSLDEQNTFSVAYHLAKLLKEGRPIKTVVSTHHIFFFNVLSNELRQANKYFFSRERISEQFLLRETGDTPFFQHLETLAEIYEAVHTGKLYTYHYNMLRSILEKTAIFHGYKKFSECIKPEEGDGNFYARLINNLNHGNDTLFEPKEMPEENKQYFRKIFDQYITTYNFNPILLQGGQA